MNSIVEISNIEDCIDLGNNKIALMFSKYNRPSGIKKQIDNFVEIKFLSYKEQEKILKGELFEKALFLGFADMWEGRCYFFIEQYGTYHRPLQLKVSASFYSEDNEHNEFNKPINIKIVSN